MPDGSRLPAEKVALAICLSLIADIEETGVYEVSISDRKCVSLLPGVVTITVVS